MRYFITCGHLSLLTYQNSSQLWGVLLNPQVAILPEAFNESFPQPDMHVVTQRPSLDPRFMKSSVQHSAGRCQIKCQKIFQRVFLLMSDDLCVELVSEWDEAKVIQVDTPT